MLWQRGFFSASFLVRAGMRAVRVEGISSLSDWGVGKAIWEAKGGGQATRVRRLEDAA